MKLSDYSWAYALIGVLLAALLGLTFWLLRFGPTSSFFDASPQVDRPHDPWVFHSVLDDRPRAITAALSDSLWVAYDAQTSGLYKAWRGGVNFDGAVYTTKHGTQPTSRGQAFLNSNDQANVWMLRRKGKAKAVTPSFKGYRVNGNVTLRYGLPIPNDSGEVIVEETPEVAFQDGHTGLVRTYHTKNTPPGIDVLLRVSLTALPASELVETNGQFVQADTFHTDWDWGATHRIDGRLRLNNDGPTTLRAFFDTRVASASTDQKQEASAADAVNGEMIFAKRCASCHQKDGKGLSGVYPPMASSEWVTGDKGRLLRILLHGLNGKIKVDEATYSGIMPAWASVLNDEEMASVATYLRQSWVNDASKVSPEEVKRLRAALEDRTKPWTPNLLNEKANQGLAQAEKASPVAASSSDASHAADSSRSAPLAHFPSVPAGPRIDGEADEVWQVAEPLPLGNVSDGIPPSSASDLSGKVRVVWDAYALYVRADVTDDVLINDSKSPWLDDGIEIYLDGGGEGGSTYDENDDQYILTLDDRQELYTKQGFDAGIKYARKLTDDGYRIEFMLPWSNYGVEPTDSMRMGFDLAVNDDDRGGTAKTKYNWHSTGATWSVPRLMAPVALSDPKGYADNPVSRAPASDENNSAEDKPSLEKGLSLKVYRSKKTMHQIGTVEVGQRPNMAKKIDRINLIGSEGNFGNEDGNFLTHIDGYLQANQSGFYDFRITTADGAYLKMDNKVIFNISETSGEEIKERTVKLSTGTHPLKLRHFSTEDERAHLHLEWRPPGSDEYVTVPKSAFKTRTDCDCDSAPGMKNIINTQRAEAPGDQSPLESVHPSYDLMTVRPRDFQPRVGGIDFLPDGRMVICNWEPAGGVYMLKGTTDTSRKNINVQRIGAGLYEPLGLAVVPADDIDDDRPGTWGDGQRIFVMQKHELTELIDHDGDGRTDEYRTVNDDWGATPNYHEFDFGLAYWNGYFWGTLAIAIMPGGASADNQNPDRGKIVKIDPVDGSLEFVADGLRVPNGIGEGYDGDLYVADNQGDWLPASKIIHVEKEAFYGNRSVDPHRSEEQHTPVVWLPQGEIGNSPSQPAPIKSGPYDGQMLHGDVTHGGLKRVFVEKVGGVRQGAVFRFTQGLEAGVNRVTWGPGPGGRQSLYVGGVGASGNWGQAGKFNYGLQRLTYNGKPTFEMLAVRARSDGLEVTFTEPLAEDVGQQPGAYHAEQWRYKPTDNYGGPKIGLDTLRILSATVSDDRRSVRLKIPGIEPGHVVYLRLARNSFRNQDGRRLWSTETWYTMNNVPQ